MNVTAKRRSAILLGIVALLGLSLACGLGTPGGEQANPTLTALSESVSRTATAAAGEETGSGNDLATAQAEATQRSQTIQATQTANASTRDESQLATATVAAPVVAELPQYGVDPAKGHLGWVHNPVTLDITGYQQVGYANDFMQVTARDFVLAADLTWNTQYGTSGCGFMFRSDGNQKKPNQYMVIATRLGNGHVIFTALANGELANVHDFFPKTEDTSFQWQNDTKNRLAVVARGHLIQIYTNGVKIGELDVTQPPPSPVIPSAPKAPTDMGNLDAVAKYQNQLKEYQDMVTQVQSNYQIALKNYKTTQAVYDEGFLAMVALSESGHTVCKFDNAWLWQIDQ